MLCSTLGFAPWLEPPARFLARSSPGCSRQHAWRLPCRRRSRQRQTAADAPLQISWEVRTPSPVPRGARLSAAERARPAAFSSSEQALELQSDGRGWARNMVNRLLHRWAALSMRDNVKESYLTPVDHPDRACPVRSHLCVDIRRRRRPPTAIDSSIAAPSPSTFASAMAARRLRPSTSPAGRKRRSGGHPDQGSRYFHRRPLSPPAKAILSSDCTRDEGFRVPLLSGVGGCLVLPAE